MAAVGYRRVSYIILLNSITIYIPRVSDNNTPKLRYRKTTFIL